MQSISTIFKARKPTRIPWKTVLIWYTAALACAVAGAFCHDVWLPIPIWKQWVETRRDTGLVSLSPVWSDSLRAIAAWGLSLLGLSSLDFSSNETDEKKVINSTQLASYEIVLITAAVTATIFLAMSVLPAHFFIQCEILVRSGKIAHPAPFTLKQISDFYYTYLLYVAGVWPAMALPVLVFFIRRIRADRALWNAATEHRLELPDFISREDVLAILRAWRRKYSILIFVGTHYTRVVAYTALLIGLEMLVFRSSATDYAVTRGIGLLLLLAVPATTIFLAILFWLFQKEWSRTLRSLDDADRRCSDETVQAQINDEILDLKSRDTQFAYLRTVLGSFGVISTFGITILSSTLFGVSGNAAYAHWEDLARLLKKALS